jgi:primosomal protein N' (replication factor Y)
VIRDEREPRFARVAVPVPVRKLFTYRVDPGRGARLAVGDRVRVPFGPRRLLGTVVEWPAAEPDTDAEVRPIDAVLADPGRLPPEVLELTRFVSDYYLCSWGEAIEAALPPESVRRTERIVRRTDAAEPDALPTRAVAKRALLDRLGRAGRPVAWRALSPSERRAASALAQDGWVEVSEVEAEPRGVGPTARPGTAPAPGHALTAAQRSVLAPLVAAIDRRTYRPFLLFGATGSGKTEVYLRAASRALAAGAGVLYLVPEIGLTPLLVDQMVRRFPGVVEVLHSGLAPGERHDAWRRIHAGASRLVVGTRSAVFAPVARLGLVVVDEEQDGSYKQEETPRYNGRDLAVVRASREGAVVVLGSATPSLESFRHARAGRYELLRLGGRIDRRPLASVERVDMRVEFRRAGRISPLSRALVRELGECVARGEQALVLRNRRGWAAAVFCPTCGNRVHCTRCSVCMTWHRAEARLRCHFCGEAHAFPRHCPSCGAAELKLLGEGTEHVEALLRDAVPGARVERMDRDTVRRRGEHERLLRRFERGEIDVLVGTQMIAKGHHFPRVTLVGVLSADQSLGIPDFRAAERAFQLLTQVAGRAGRGDRPGRVIVQAFDPDHPVLTQAADQDYEAFYDREMRYRQALRYPPLSALVHLVVSHREEHRARLWAERLADEVARQGGGRIVVSGPGPAPIEKIKGRHRHRILVRSAGRRRLIAAVERAIEAVAGVVPRRSLVVDVDPYSLL